MTEIRDIRVIAPNFKHRLSGVTSTIIQLVPVQNRLGQQVATLGPGLPATLPALRFSSLWQLWRKPADANVRVWHARRNNEMLAGLVLKHVLRMPLKVLFTSASQRKHTGWTKFLISKVDGVVATSAKTAAYLERPSRVIMHGVDTTRFSPAPDKGLRRKELGLAESQKFVGCFGRVRHQKGTDLFVDAMIALLPSRPDWSAIIAGRATVQHEGFERDLKARVEAAGLGARILFVGEKVDIPDWYGALDLFIAPQRWEGFGLTPLEAMASGVPVVATDVGAFAELLATRPEPATGAQNDDALARPGTLVATSAEAIATAAAAFMDNTPHRQKASRSALAHAQTHFALETEAKALGAVYAELME